MGVEKNSSNPAKLNKTNVVDIYRPPALRRSLENPRIENSIAECCNTIISAEKIKPIEQTIDSERKEEVLPSSLSNQRPVKRERRPDRAVYVPRPRRSQTTPPQVNTASEQPSSTTSSLTLSSPLSKTIDKSKNRKRTDRISSNNKKDDTKNMSTLNSVIMNCDKTNFVENNRNTAEINQKTYNITLNTDLDLINNCSEVKLQPSSESTNLTSNNIVNMTNLNEKLSNDESNESSPIRIEDANGIEKLSKCDNDIKELQRASKEINRSNRRIMKQTFTSDILEIPEAVEDNVVKKQITKDDNNSFEEVEEKNDDWDSIYDDNGECVDPKILEELTAAVGKVKIEIPKQDYSAYHIKQSILNEEEFPHVLEISNFPVEFKTQDLMMIFSAYKELGFDIKWVDDTHALAVFSTSRAAAEALTMGHPFVVLKPLADATTESRNKAKKCSASLQPYRPRPETCAALARRLVTGALGVRLKTAAEERENEKRVLKEAKERKLLAAKQRDEIWES